MSIEEKQTCNMHTKEKEKSGTCCLVADQENAEQLTYEHHAEVGPAPKEQSVSELLQEGMELQRRLEDE